ncbi:flavodoxin domain-containing protein [Thalassotalea sp. 1_MG-2023]|uniref:flavodoxin domain-containing protein n=1 Tax=Thalassotalea sp. 1_MG-2023 TaxID=3062680 RepID=UPI0026E26AA6|nr:flavodoxin domain-containing protein [Thalassotalea sp. 1_MG-2023]MDO6427646.1 flavodoxin domain-containing protein [Thalassotalea sp. 1_MG-2023]
MSSFQIIVGSMLGGTEYVAEACEESLVELGHDVTLHLSPDLSNIATQNQTWLICTSTHGAGDYPDNLLPFIDQLTSTTIDLSSTKYMVIGIGDSNYDTFCLAAKNIDKLIESKGCERLITIKTFDMTLDIDPEEEAQAWLLTNKDQL